MRKLRVWPILGIAALSAIILFGGWTLYHNHTVAEPLSESLQSVQGVSAASAPIIEQDNVSIRIELDQQASLREVYEDVLQKSRSIVGNRYIDLEIHSNSNERLDQIWSQALFEVAQAMELKNYADIPEAMDRLAKANDQITIVTEMDETNVYITIVQDTASKYIVLPRTPATIGVLANA